MLAFNVFSEEVILENDAVLLRPLNINDFEHLLQFSENEPEIWQYSLVRVAGSENLNRYISQALDAKAALKEYSFIVFDKKQKKYAGSTRFYDIQLSNASLQLGYTWYGKDFRGTGLNKHCKFLMLDFAFNKLNIERVEFREDNNNEKSIAAMKIIGCTAEAVLRSSWPTPDGGRRDTIVLSILRAEWISDLREQLKKKFD